MTKRLLKTQTVGNTQYQLYSVKILHTASCTDMQGHEHQDKVMITAYGIITVTYIGKEEIYYDSGPLSPSLRNMEGLFLQICVIAHPHLDEMRMYISQQCEEWIRLANGSPLDVYANQTLKRKIDRGLSRDSDM
jgi:hypothetical protein